MKLTQFYRSGMSSVALLSMLLVNAQAIAGECSAVFTGGIGGNSNNGEIEFGEYAVIFNNPTTTLVASSIKNNSKGNSCNTADCTATGSATDTMNFNPFQTTNSKDDLTVKQNASGTIGTTTNEYDEVKVEKNGSLSVSGNYTYYEMDKLTIGENAIATFPAGDYWIEEFKMEKNSQMVISGSGTARFYFKKDSTIGENAQFNTYNDGSYHPENVMIYAKKELKLEKNSHLVGFIYSDDKVTFGEGTITRGSLSVDEGKLEKNAQIYYMGDALTELETGGYCSSTPLHHYEIIHDGNGSTCDGESITIRACANADCSSLYTAPTSVDLLGDGNTLVSETFTGSVSTSINHTTVETLTLSLANQSIAAENALECDSGGGSSCNIVFSSDSCPVAGSCAAVFPDGLNNSDAGGKIKFENTGRLTSNNDIYLTTNDVDLNGSATTCETADCVASNTIASTMTSSYTSYTSNTNFKADNTTKTITGNDFKDVESKNYGTLNMDPSYDKYYFKKLKAKSDSTLNLTPGDYYVTELEFNDATVNVVGDGTARIWVTNKAKFKEDAIVNGGSSGDPSKLFVYFFAQSDEKIKVESGAYVAAYIYSEKKVEVKGDSKFYGAITSQGELKVKNSAEVISDTSTLDNAEFGVACTSAVAAVNHYRFEYDGNGLTCAVENVVIKACANEDCSSLYDSQSDIGFDVTTDSNTVTSNLSFTGSTSVDIGESSPQTVVMGLSSASPNASLQCYENGSLEGSCDYVLEDTGFIFLNTASGSLLNELPVQISGKPSNQGHNAANLVLQAVQTNTTTGACVPLFADAGGVDVQLSVQCENPGSCITLPNNANDLVFSNNGNDYYVSKYPSFGAHRLYFDNESKAAFSINYPDAGQIKLYAQMSIVLSDSETKVMTGNTNSFVVRPFGFYLDATGNPAASNNSGGVYRQAGENFDMTVSAVQWQSADDCDNNGQVDIGASCGGGSVTADLSDNSTTPNFGQESSAEAASVSTSIVSPVGGDSPALSSNSFTGFSSGSKTNTVTWDNVGVFSATAALNDDGLYLGKESLTGYIANVGRFVPSYFELNTSGVTQGCSAFSYMGQDFSISYEVLAKGIGGNTLSNYDSSAGDPLTDTDYHGFAGFSLVAENNNDGTNLSSRFGELAVVWADGVGTGANTLQFARALNGSGHPQLEAPYSSMELGLLVEDNDDSAVVDFNVLDINAGSASNCVSAASCDAKKLGTGTQDFRFGRLAGAEVFGVETENLTLPLVTQFYDGARFVTATDDSCTVLKPSDFTISGVSNNPFSAIDNYDVYQISDNSVVGSSSIQIGGNTTTTTVSAENGEFDFTLGATSVQGYIPISIDVSDYPWLQFDWSTNGTGAVEDAIPTYNINFGQFRGNDRVIYWREKR